MDIYDFIIAVFVGNLLTAAFIWGAVQSTRFKSDADIPWLVYAALGLPLALAILSFISTGAQLPSLDALASR